MAANPAKQAIVRMRTRSKTLLQLLKEQVFYGLWKAYLGTCIPKLLSRGGAMSTSNAQSASLPRQCRQALFD